MCGTDLGVPFNLMIWDKISFWGVSVSQTHVALLKGNFINSESHLLVDDLYIAILFGTLRKPPQTRGCAICESHVEISLIAF